MANHTPGLWKAIRPKNDPNAWDVVTEKSGTVIVRLPWGTYEQIVHLIAAAPAMLNLLKVCEHLPACSSWAGQECDCAVPEMIAKAEGR